MEVSRIIAEIDAQIAKLQQARALLQGDNTAPPKAQRGRPKKSAVVAPAAAVKAVASSRKKRNLSADARKRIADAQKRRWAERRKEGE